MFITELNENKHRYSIDIIKRQKQKLTNRNRLCHRQLHLNRFRLQWF